MVRRRRVRNYPAHSLYSVMGLANTIFKQNAGLPVSRHLLAQEIGTSVSSSTFITKLAASEQYGLTQGRYKDDDISLTELGLAVVASKSAGELFNNIKAAAYHPTQFNKLRVLLKGQGLPNDNFLKGLLVRDVGVHPELTEEYISIYKNNLKYIEDFSTGSLTNNSMKDFGARVSSNDTFSEALMSSQSTNQEISYPTKTCVLIHSKADKQFADEIKAFLVSLSLPIDQISIATKGFEKPDLTTKDFALTLIVDNPDAPEPEHYTNYAIGLAHGLSKQAFLVLHLTKSDPSYLNSHPYIDESTIVLAGNIAEMKVSLLFKLTELGNLTLSF